MYSRTKARADPKERALHYLLLGGAMREDWLQAAINRMGRSRKWAAQRPVFDYRNYQGGVIFVSPISKTFRQLT